jgi:hypothetical protein
MRATDNQPRRLRTIRVTVAVQVLAMAGATVIALPSFIDRFTRPLTCTGGCLDFRGIDFVFFALFLVPPAIALSAAAWLLIRRPRIGITLVLAVDIAILGLAAYSALANAVQPGVDPDAPPFPWPLIQNALVALPALASLALVVASLGPSTAPDLPVRVIRAALVAQVLAMAGCVVLTTPHLSDRLSGSGAPDTEGVAFVTWTLFLLPAALALSLIAWRIAGAARRRPWILAAVAVDVYVLAALAIFSTLRLGGPPGAQLDPLPAGFIDAQFLLVAVPAAATFVLATMVTASRPVALPPVH